VTRGIGSDNSRIPAPNIISQVVSKIAEFIHGNDPCLAHGLTSAFLAPSDREKSSTKIELLLREEDSTTEYFNFYSRWAPRHEATYSTGWPEQSMIVDGRPSGKSSKRSTGEYTELPEVFFAVATTKQHVEKRAERGKFVTKDRPLPFDAG